MKEAPEGSAKVKSEVNPGGWESQWLLIIDVECSGELGIFVGGWVRDESEGGRKVRARISRVARTVGVGFRLGGAEVEGCFVVELFVISGEGEEEGERR